MAAVARHLVWLMTFVAIAALPLLSLVLPHFAIRIFHAVAAMAGGLDLSAPGEHPRATLGAGLAVCLWFAYSLGVAALLWTLAAARIALARLWRSTGVDAVQTDFPDLARRRGVAGTVSLRFADAPIAPMTWDNRILLPATAANWSTQRRREVLSHELSHMARRDSLIQLLAGVVRALFWFSPAVWHGLRELRIEQEHACDECVLASGAEPTTYAQTLLDVAVGLRAPPLGAGVSSAMVQRSDLERRVVAVLAPMRRRAVRLIHMSALSVAVVGSSALIAAAQPIDSARILPPLAPLASTAPFQDAIAPLAGTPPPLTVPLQMADNASEGRE